MIRIILDTPCGRLLILSALISTVNGACPSTAAECINKAKFDQLKQGDPSFYCEEGAKLAAAAQNCLRDCSFSEKHPQLVQLKNTINKFCADMDPDCPNVCDTFVDQTRCYDEYGGLDNVTKHIATSFESGARPDCNQLYWGRSCQKMRNCSFNLNLDNYLVSSNRIIGLNLAICGSESLKSLLPYLDQADGCKPDIESSIINKCNISCSLAEASTSTEICAQLEQQAKCLQEQTAGCTDAERLYVGPRLNTYAIANKYLRCSIKYNGVKVQTSGRDIEYSNSINTCTLPSRPILESTLTSSIDLLKQLFNFDTVVVNFCLSKGEQKQKIKDCKNSFLGSLTPQAKLLIRAQDEYDSDNIDFLPKVGGFPVDHFGMAYIYDWLPEACNNLQWSTRLCVPASVNGGPASTGPASTGPASTEKSTITTPQAPRTKGQNSLDFIKSSTGGMLPSAAVLTVTSLLGFALM